nr:MAG TPA: tail collar fiber protein [Caudoviricetes sp.]
MATEVELFNAAVVSALPHGMIVAHAGKTVPDGFLLCNGAAVSRKTYAKLFEAIGELWGAGDGSTTFNLPDSDGRVLQGATDVSKVGKYLEAGLPNITGGLTAAGATAWQNPSGVFFLSGQSANCAAFVTSAQSQIGLRFSAKNDSALFSGKSTVQPDAFQTLIIIKV